MSPSLIYDLRDVAPMTIVAFATLLAALWIAYWWLKPNLISTSGIAALSREVADLSARVKSQSRLLCLDELTGLPNGRKLVQIALPDALRHAAELKQPLTLAYLDLDCFKQINDRQGHIVADQVLLRAAKAMQGALRRFRCTDQVYRHYNHGDEFVILLPDAELKRATVILKQVLGKLREVGLSASVGALVLGAGSTMSQDRLLEEADCVMRRVKSAGGGKVEIERRS